MIRTLRFDRPGSRFGVPEVTVPLNNGWTLADAKHRAVVAFPEGVRINGALLSDETQQSALKAVVFAAAAFNDAGQEYDELIRRETEEGAVKIFASDSDDRSDMSARRTLERETTRLELLLVVASQSFLALYQGRSMDHEAYECLTELTQTFLADDSKRDVYVQ